MASSTAGVRTRTSTGSVRHVRNKEAWHEAGIFLKNFVRHPLMLGSVIPSSRYLINRVLDNIDWQQTRTGVEYGPGVGTFTRPILGRMRADARLLAIELNADFGQLLRSSINDGRLCVADGSAADVREWMYSFELAK